MNENYVHYYAESLGHGRGILRCDVVIDGALVPELSGTVGSPAPLDEIRKHERTHPLGPSAKETAT